jgi:hypothetical protein
MGAASAHEQRIAVGSRFRRHGRTKHSAGAGAVFHNDRLPHLLAELLGNHARQYVGLAARRIRHDHFDELFRVPLRKNRAGDKHGQNDGQDAASESREILPHGSSLQDNGLWDCIFCSAFP